jgi:hypothetical protein
MDETYREDFLFHVVLGTTLVSKRVNAPRRATLNESVEVIVS